MEKPPAPKPPVGVEVKCDLCLGPMFQVSRALVCQRCGAVREAPHA